MDRAVQLRHGPRSEVDTARIAALLEMKADLTLPELQQQLMAETGRRTSVPHLWRVVRKMGFRLKKSRSTPPNETPRPTGSGARLS